mgnify:CR=1 FL=1
MRRSFAALCRVTPLCAAAGFVDAFGYFALDRVFTANMTGNTVLFAAAVARGDWTSAPVYFITLASFVAGAVTAAVLRRWLATPCLLLLIVAALVATVGVTAPRSDVAVVILAVGMGVQAASLTVFAGVRLQTVVLTGALVNLADAVIDRVWPRESGPSPHPPAISVLSASWLSYAVGAGGGVLAVDRWRYALLIPAAVLTAVAIALEWNARSPPRRSP